jgi:hypothetical protein
MADLRISAFFSAFALICFGASCSSHTTSDDLSGSGGSKSAHKSATNKPTASSEPDTMDTGAEPADQPSAADTPEPSNSGTTPPSAARPSQPIDGMPKPRAMDECDLHTQYAGDEYCILPPPPDQGFQVHVGPADYDNPEPQYMLAAGEEKTSDFRVTSTNDKPVHFYYRQFRMRPGAHHNIVSLTTGGGFGMGRRIGTSNNLSEDSPKDGVTAPENEGVGIPLAAKATINVSLHSINITDKPQLRELWINFWYRDDSEVTEEVSQMFQTGSVAFAVQPRQDTVLGPYRCNISGDGRMLWFYGHRHANNVRFSAWRIRGQQRDLFYEGLHWEEPIVLEYSSTVTNPVPDQNMGIEGGWTGILDMKAGDVLEWECHVVNKTDEILRFTNETYTGEMCIMDAELVGANCGLF